MSQINNTWFILGATVVGIVTAVSAIFLEIAQEKKRQKTLNRELCEMRDLRDKVAKLQAELNSLTASQRGKREGKRRNNRSRNHTSSSAPSFTSETDWNSALDSSDLEFYDLSDAEGSRTAINKPLSIVLEAIDERLERIQSEDAHVQHDLDQIAEELEELRLEWGTQISLLWRLGRIDYRRACVTHCKDTKERLFASGISHCEEALLSESDPDPDSPSTSPHSSATATAPSSADIGQSHKWLAILLGSQMEHQHIRDKVRSSFKFKRHLDEAQRHLPEDGTVRHMIGRYLFEVGALTWIERKTLESFGEVGEVGPEVALVHLQAAEKLATTPLKDNHLFLAKCLIARGDNAGAVHHLLEAENILRDGPATDGRDGQIDTEVKHLLAKYHVHR